MTWAPPSLLIQFVSQFLSSPTSQFQRHKLLQKESCQNLEGEREGREAGEKAFLCLPPYPALEFSVKINCKPCSFSSLEKRLLVFSSSSILVFECGEERRRRSSRARTFKLLSNQRRPFSSLIYISIFTPFGNSKRVFDQSSPTLQKRVRNVRKRAQKSVIAFFFERILSGCTFNIRKTL